MIFENIKFGQNFPKIATVIKNFERYQFFRIFILDKIFQILNFGRKISILIKA